MGLVPLTYRRPSYVSTNSITRKDSTSSHDYEKASSLRSGVSSASRGVPDALSFDRILRGETCPPMALSDFMDYLMYVEHTAENLQFYLWHQDYVRRFHKADTSDIAMAPEWTQAMEDDITAKLRKEACETSRRQVGAAADMFKGTYFEMKACDTAANGGTHFLTPPSTASYSNHDDETSTCISLSPFSTASTIRSPLNDAFAAAGAQTPFTVQPYREEINRIIATYIVDGAPRQLNLSGRDRKALLHAVSYTTHPSTMRTVFRTVNDTLRRQSHPNFVRWSAFNGNPPRIAFASSLGYGGILMAFTVAVLVTLSRADRWWRAFAALAWIPGIWAVVASHRGMCICMYLFSKRRRHIRPWELFAEMTEDDETGTITTKGGRHKRSFDSFGSGNSFEDEPWVGRYERRSLVRKIFDREASIQEPALQEIHNVLMLQAALVGLVASVALTAVFVALPAGNFF